MYEVMIMEVTSRWVALKADSRLNLASKSVAPRHEGKSESKVFSFFR